MHPSLPATLHHPVARYLAVTANEMIAAKVSPDLADLLTTLEYLLPLRRMVAPGPHMPWVKLNNAILALNRQVERLMEEGK